MTRLVLLAAAALLVAAAPAANVKLVQQQISAAEDAVNGAYLKNDLPKYFSYYAPDLRALYPEGPTTLPEYVKAWTALIHAGGGIESFTTRNMVIQVSPAGDAAVASYQATARTRNPDKTAVTASYDETDVWFKRAGAWKIVEIHYSENSK